MPVSYTHLEKDLSAYDWKEKFKGHLPNNRKNDFEKICNEAEEIYFGNKKPTKQQVRALRFIYCKSRRTFFKELSATKYFYYKFLKVL